MYTITMSIEPISAGTSMQCVRAEAAMRVTGMVLSSMEQKGESLQKLLNTAQLDIITDPALGNRVNILA